VEDVDRLLLNQSDTDLAGFGLVTGILAVFSLWLAMVAMIVGAYTRSAQFDLVRTRWFAVARRHGIGTGFKSLIKGFLHQSNASGRFREGPMFIFVTAVALIAANIAPISLLVVVHNFMSEKALKSPEGVALDDSFNLAGLLCIFVAALAWFRGLGYIARPEAARRSRLPRLRFPNGLNAESRDRLSLNAFWYSQIWLGEALGMLLPWIIVSAAVLPTTGNLPSNAPADELASMILLVLSPRPRSSCRCWSAAVPGDALRLPKWW
jgi:hypothetical protein